MYWLHHIDRGGVLITPDCTHWHRWCTGYTTLTQVVYWLHHVDIGGVLVTPHWHRWCTGYTTLTQVVYWLHHVDTGGVLVTPRWHRWCTGYTTLIQVMYWLHLISPRWYRWWNIHYISLTQDVDHWLYVINIDRVWWHSTETDGMSPIQVEYGCHLIDTGGALITYHWYRWSTDYISLTQL